MEENKEVFSELEKIKLRNIEQIRSQVVNQISNLNEDKNLDNEESLEAIEVVKSTEENTYIEQQNEIVENKSELKNELDFSYFDGKLLDLMGWNVLRIVLTIMTFGIGASWGECLFLKYKINNTILSGKRLKFEGEGSQLFVEQFKWTILTLITFGIYSFWVPIKKKNWVVANIHFEDETTLKDESFFGGRVLGLLGINLLCVFITLISFGILYPLAECIKLKWLSKYTVIDKNRVIFEGKALNLFGKYLIWGLLMIVTLGIYGFWVPLKKINWEVENTYLIKNI